MTRLSGPMIGQGSPHVRERRCAVDRFEFAAVVGCDASLDLVRPSRRSFRRREIIAETFFLGVDDVRPVRR
jgi:hypothetical protein